MPVAETLKALQEQTGMTTAELAAKANLPVDTINKIRSGTTRNPSTDTLQRLAGALGVSLDHLVTGSLPETANTANPPKTGGTEALLQFYLAALNSQKDAYDTALKHANEDKRRWFYVALALIVFIVFVLVWDITHPTMGYVQY